MYHRSRRDCDEYPEQLGEEAINYAHAIRIEALRRLGEMLQVTEKATGTRGQLAGQDFSGGRLIVPPGNTAASLKELGLSKTTSSLAQKLADLPRGLDHGLSGRDVLDQ